MAKAATSSSDRSAPYLSVVVPARDDSEAHRAVAAMREFEACAGVERLLVAAGGAPSRGAEVGVRAVRAEPGSDVAALRHAGLRAASTPLVLFLSPDVALGRGAVDALVRAASHHPEAAAFQAKVLDAEAPRRFDEAGAAGGLMDRLGYTFALGRLFDRRDCDDGRFDAASEIFWGCAAALLVRRDAALSAGGFDAAFGAFQDDVDLSWRLQSAGWRIRAVPEARAFRRKPTVARGVAFRDVYRNYRNNWTVLIKNLAPRSLAAVVAQRAVLDTGTLLYGLLRRDWRTPLACLLGALWILAHLPTLIVRRRRASTSRTAAFADVEARLYPRSTVIQRFCRGVESVVDLPRFAVPGVLAETDPRAGSDVASAPAVSVVVPTWNEAANLAPLFRRVTCALRGARHEILVVDDGSPDGTADRAERLAIEKYPSVRVVRRSGARGLSGAILDGVAAARGAVIAVMDADLQHDANILPRLFSALEVHEVAVGSRYAFRGGCRGWSFARRLQSRAAALLTRRVLGLTTNDPLSGYFAVRADVWRRLAPGLSADGWKILLEVLASEPKLRVAEIPFTFQRRRRGTSKMNVAVVGAWLRALVRLRRIRGSVPAAPAPAAWAWSPAL